MASPTPTLSVASPAKKTVHEKLTEDMSGEQSKAMKLLAGHNLGLILIVFFWFWVIVIFYTVCSALNPDFIGDYFRSKTTQYQKSV